MQQERVKPTLKRTKFACVNCKAAKAACDSNRPCAWCIRHALQDSCVDAPRKTRTSKKICCDPSLHKNVVFKQEYKGFQLGLAADFSSSTSLPVAPPLSPPGDIFPIEDFLAPSFDFGTHTSNNQPCTNCPLYQTCAKDAPQRLICATSSSPPQSPLSPEQLGGDDLSSPSLSSSETFPLPPMSLSSHPDYCLQMPSPKPSTPSQPQETEKISYSQPSTPYSSQLLPSPQTIQMMSQPSPNTIQCLQAALQFQSTPPQSSPQTPQTPQTSQTPQISTPLPPQDQQEQQQNQVRTPKAQGGGCCSSSNSLPPLLDDVCNCQSLVQKEMAKINASLETISALMQLQNASLLPTATFQVPDTTLDDCNDEFAKALGYDNREDLLASAAVHAITISTKEMMVNTKKEEEEEEEEQERREKECGEGGRRGEEEPTTPKQPKQNKPCLTALVPEKGIAALLKCANELPKATAPLVNQIVFSSKRGENKFFTVLIKPCGWFSYISILKQHPQLIDGLVVLGE